MRLFLAAIFVSLAAASAAADPTPPRDIGKMVTDDCAKARRAHRDCVLNIDGHEVEGATPRSTGTTVTVLTGSKHPSLISVRRDFIPEILKTAEDL